MNSWYVATLLRHKHTIKCSIVSVEPVKQRYPYIESSTDALISIESSPPLAIETYDFEDENYTDLLLVEGKLNELYRNRRISSKELKIMNLFSDGCSFEQISKAVELTRPTVAKIFELICDRVAYLLGDIFTDDGYLEYIKNKYNLTTDEVERARNYMNSNYKNFVRRTDA